MVLIVILSILFLPMVLTGKTVFTALGKYRLSLPLSLIASQKKPMLSENNDVCISIHIQSIDGTINNSIYINKQLNNKLLLKYDGENINGLMELIAKLCENKFQCNINDIVISNTGLNNELYNKFTPISTDEIVDWIGTKRELLLPLPRRVIHELNLLHRGFGAMLIHSKTKEIFVHKRSSEKRIFPSMLDMFIGGVSLHKEAVMTTLMRELNEEVGIDLTEVQLPHLDYNVENKDEAYGTQVISIGETMIRTNMNQCLVDCFLINLAPIHADNIYFKDGEVEWGQWISMERLYELLEGDGYQQFVSDGMQVSNYIYLSQ
jgi:isopentenyldiphosphate isomerase